MNETNLNARIRLIASKYGAVLWRNNSGVATGHDGRPVRFGLANISSQANRILKSSDLIGWTCDGRFLAIECKRPGWRYTGTEREHAQSRFIEAVNLNGGVAGFATSEYEATLIICRDGPPMLNKKHPAG